MEHLSSVSTFDFTMGPKEKELVSQDPFYAPWKDSKFRGNMNTTIVKTSLGKTIMIQHDVSSEHPYSRIHLLQGTKGEVRKYPVEHIALGEEWADDAKMKELYAQYSPEIVKRVGEMAKKVGGHGGMDYVMAYRLAECMKLGLAPDIDVYDAAAWSAPIPLSEASVANGGAPQKFPDFTRGKWQTRQPV